MLVWLNRYAENKIGPADRYYTEQRVKPAVLQRTAFLIPEDFEDEICLQIISNIYLDTKETNSTEESLSSFS